MHKANNHGRGRPGSLVYCLAIDLVKSVKAIIDLSTDELSLFNSALIGRMTPHIEGLGLQGYSYP